MHERLSSVAVTISWFGDQPQNTHLPNPAQLACLQVRLLHPSAHESIAEALHPEAPSHCVLASTAPILITFLLSLAPQPPSPNPQHTHTRTRAHNSAPARAHTRTIAQQHAHRPHSRASPRGRTAPPRACPPRPPATRQRRRRRTRCAPQAGTPRLEPGPGFWGGPGFGGSGFGVWGFTAERLGIGVWGFGERGTAGDRGSGLKELGRLPPRALHAGRRTPHGKRSGRAGGRAAGPRRRRQAPAAPARAEPACMLCACCVRACSHTMPRRRRTLTLSRPAGASALPPPPPPVPVPPSLCIRETSRFSASFTRAVDSVSASSRVDAAARARACACTTWWLWGQPTLGFRRLCRHMRGRGQGPGARAHRHAQRFTRSSSRKCPRACKGHSQYACSSRLRTSAHACRDIDCRVACRAVPDVSCALPTVQVGARPQGWRTAFPQTLQPHPPPSRPTGRPTTHNRQTAHTCANHTGVGLGAWWCCPCSRPA